MLISLFVRGFFLRGERLLWEVLPQSGMRWTKFGFDLGLFLCRGERSCAAAQFPSGEHSFPSLP